MHGNELFSKIGLWGHYCGVNLGDEVVIAALIQHIRARMPEAQIYGISMDPVDTRERHGIPAFPMLRGARERTTRGTVQATPTFSDTGSEGRPEARLRGRTETSLKRLLRQHRRLYGSLRYLYHRMRAAGEEVHFLWNAYHNLRDIDLLILAGSHPLYDDWSGPWMHPYNVFKWAMLAQVTRTKFVPLCVGAGPLHAPLSRFFIRRAMGTTYYRSYRDAHSAEVIKELGVPGEHPVFPDMAFSYQMQHLPGWEASAAAGRTVVGISTSAVRDPRYQPGGRQDKYGLYLLKLAGFITWLLQNDYTVQFLYSDFFSDPPVGADLKHLLRQHPDLNLEEQLIDRPIHSLDELLGQIARCDYVIGGRFHCHILPFLFGKPVLAIAYHPKTVNLMAYLGQTDYCVDMDSMSVDMLIEHFERLRRDEAQIKSVLSERVPACRQALEDQYDRLFGPPVAPASTATPERALSDVLA